MLEHFDKFFLLLSYSEQNDCKVIPSFSVD